MAEEGKNLVDEIYDEFLVCKICLESYKNPKTLNCLHVFCCECLEKHNETEMERSSYRYRTYMRTVSCPICRKKTDLPTGGISRLPENFLVSNLTEVVDRRRPGGGKHLCQICQQTQSKNKASSKCIECVKLLCKQCVQTHKQTHVTKNHSLFDIESEKDVMCKVHADEPVRFYCEPCEVCVCIVCTFQEHKDHDLSTFKEGMNKYGGVLQGLVENVKNKVSLFQTQLVLISKCGDAIKMAEDQIRDSTINLIGSIRNNEKKLMNEIHEAFGENTREFIESKVCVQETLDNILSTCNLTDIIMKDKGIELLLLKKNLQQKLELLQDVNVPKVPPKVDRQFHYVPSTVRHGFIREGATEDAPRNDELICGYDKHQSVEIQTEHPTKNSIGTSMGMYAAFSDKETSTQADIHLIDDIPSDIKSKDIYDAKLITPGKYLDKFINPSKWNRPKLTSSLSVDDSSLQRNNKNDGIVCDNKLPIIEKENKCVGTIRKLTMDSGIGTACVLTLEKETGTPYIHQIHRNTCTDNLLTEDKQTNTAMVAAAYRQLIAPSKSVSMKDAETSTEGSGFITMSGLRRNNSGEALDGSQRVRCTACQQYIRNKDNDNACNNVDLRKDNGNTSEESAKRVPYLTATPFVRRSSSKENNNGS